MADNEIFPAYIIDIYKHSIFQQKRKLRQKQINLKKD